MTSPTSRMPTRLRAFRLIVNGPMTRAMAIRSMLSGPREAETAVVRNARAALSGMNSTAIRVNSAPRKSPTMIAQAIRGITPRRAPIICYRPPRWRFRPLRCSLATVDHVGDGVPQGGRGLAIGEGEQRFGGALTELLRPPAGVLDPVVGSGQRDDLPYAVLGGLGVSEELLDPPPCRCLHVAERRDQRERDLVLPQILA